VENGSGEIEADGTMDQQISIVKPYSRKAYKIIDWVCCRVAFKLVLCVGNQMLSRLKRLQDQDIMLHKWGERPVMGLTLTLVQWMKDFFSFIMRNFIKKMLFIFGPDSYSKLEVSQTFKTIFSNFDKAVCVTY
jgi:hypothetical protein